MLDCCSHQSSHSSGCCGDSGDDLPSDAFGLQSVCWLDRVHPGSDGGCRRDKIDVTVAVIILFKLKGSCL